MPGHLVARIVRTCALDTFHAMMADYAALGVSRPTAHQLGGAAAGLLLRRAPARLARARAPAGRRLSAWAAGLGRGTARPPLVASPWARDLWDPGGRRGHGDAAQGDRAAATRRRPPKALTALPFNGDSCDTFT